MAITLNGTTGITTPADTITGNATVGGTLTVNGVSNALGVPGTAGNVMASNGTAWVSTAPSGGAVTGQTIQYGSSTTPSGYLKCDGSTYNIAAYPTLAAAIGSLPANAAQYANNGLGSGSVAYLNSNVIQSNGSNVIAYSSNSGVSFTTVTISSIGGWPSNAINMVWTGTNYVAPGANSCVTLLSGIVYSSSISTTSSWNFTSTNINFQVGGMAYTGSRVVALGYAASSSAYSTTNGTTWAAGGATGHLSRSATYGAGLIVSVGTTTALTTPYIATSTDGGTWTSRTVPAGTLGTDFYFVNFQNSLFIATSSNGTIVSSPDGITWTLKGQLPKTISGQVLYLSATGIYYVNGYGSTDLINWFVLPNTIQAPYALQYQATDGTRLFSNSSTYNPFPYTTGTQFIVPNFGPNGFGGSIAFVAGSANPNVPLISTGSSYGAYYYIKT